jgi:peroxiredoxin
VKGRYEEFRQAGAEVLAVSFAPPAIVAAYLEESPAPFPVVSDPTKAAYEAFGLGRTSWGHIIRAGVVLRFLKLLFRGWLPRRPRKNEDVLQLGGDFVLDAAHRLVYAHRSAEPTDRPPVDQLLNAVRAANTAQRKAATSTEYEPLPAED